MSQVRTPDATRWSRPTTRHFSPFRSPWVRRWQLPLIICYLVFATDAAATRTSSPSTPPAEKQLLWGDTHLHTSWSADAFTFGNRSITPQDAFRFARGDTITLEGGLTARLSRPLDFLVVSDHAEYLGVFQAAASGWETVLSTPQGPAWANAIRHGNMGQLFQQYQHSVLGTTRPVLDTVMQTSLWNSYVRMADSMNQPGTFTAFIGYEWTAMPGGDTLHRVVVFRDDAGFATRSLPFTAIDSTDPEMLWQHLAAYERETGGSVLAIPHNGNLSNGAMFAPRTVQEKPVTPGYARARTYWEPLYEVSQMKGDSETHPLLSPSDEYADYETWDSSLHGRAPVADELQYEYARSALKLGLEWYAKLGANPFMFGLQAGTDSHTGLSTADENNFFGKFPDSYPVPGRIRRHMGGDVASLDAPENWRLAASGYTAVWAVENTRKSIFDAMRRREVYATTGTRLRLRYVAGWDLASLDTADAEAVARAFQHYTPMGSELIMRGHSSSASPAILVMANKDPRGADIHRVQVIKGWLDSEGISHESIFDITNNTNSPPQPAEGGKQSANHSPEDKGWSAVTSLWQDPEFDPGRAAFYYIRVIEVPSKRWTAFDVERFGLNPPADLPLTSQERAYGSPIWYLPR